MLIVRAIEKRDLNGLLTLARQTGPGMTTLQPDRSSLAARVEIACASFAEELPPEQRDYLFVMEDADNGTLVGVSAIKSAVGLDEPFYNYRIGTLVHSSTELKVLTRMDTLYLSNDLTGCAELCSLFLHPHYRYGLHGKLLSKSRFMFIAQHPHLFPEKLIAEMRGYLDASGESPFWEGLGRHFFQMDFHRADGLSGLGNKAFIAELMPRHPLYVAYLPKSAQEAIGMVQAETAPARRLLEQEGMYYEGYVDIFDAGAVLQARIRELRAMRQSVLCTVGQGETEPDSNDPLLIANTGLRDFRVIATPGATLDGRIPLDSRQQKLLQRYAGDTVRILSLNTRKP